MEEIKIQQASNVEESNIWIYRRPTASLSRFSPT